MSDRTYVIVDIETTGLSREWDRITEIAAVRFDGQEIVDEWQTLVNPRMRIPSSISYLTGITDEMVADAPEITDVLPEFFGFLGEEVFVAHNASFDHGFLSGNAQRYLGHHWSNDVLCTRKVANRVVSHLPRKGLGALCDYYGIVNSQAHRAMADVLATTEVLKEFLSLVEQYHAQPTVEELLKLQKKSVGWGRSVFGRVA